MPLAVNPEKLSARFVVNPSGAGDGVHMAVIWEAGSRNLCGRPQTRSATAHTDWARPGMVFSVQYCITLTTTT